MVHQGRIEDWNDARGFGFVRPHAGTERAFVHISACRLKGRRPDNGLVVSYRTQTDERGRLNAIDVQLVRQPVRRHGAIARAQAETRAQGRGFTQLLRFFIGITVLAALATALYLDVSPWWLPTGYLVLSLLTFIQYAIDKSQAQANAWRTPESTLQMMAVAGGWPGALLAQSLLNHKSSKSSFQLTFWFCVALNLVVVGTLLGPTL